MGKIYEKRAFTRFRCEPVDFIEEKILEKVIHKHTFLGAKSPKVQVIWRVTGCSDKYVKTQCSYSKHTI